MLNKVVPQVLVIVAQFPPSYPGSRLRGIERVCWRQIRGDRIQQRLMELGQSLPELMTQEIPNHIMQGIAAASGVDGTLLQRYEVVRKKKLPALVPLRGNSCSGCNMNVPPQPANTLRSTMGTDVCPNCHRIIFVPEALGDEAAGR